MQDYNYVWGQCFDITLELSCCHYPSEDKIQDFWDDNKIALIEYIKQIHLGKSMLLFLAYWNLIYCKSCGINY